MRGEIATWLERKRRCRCYSTDEHHEAKVEHGWGVKKVWVWNDRRWYSIADKRLVLYLPASIGFHGYARRGITMRVIRDMGLVMICTLFAMCGAGRCDLVTCKRFHRKKHLRNRRVTLGCLIFNVTSNPAQSRLSHFSLSSLERHQGKISRCNRWSICDRTTRDLQLITRIRGLNGPTDHL